MATEAAQVPGQPAATRFPLGLCIAAILATGAGLGASALGFQWGAGSQTADALDHAWVYVNVALLWTLLALWPAMAMGRRNGGRILLMWDLGAILAAATPAIAVAALLGSVSSVAIATTLTVQLSLAMFAMGAMAWQARISPAIITGILVGLAVVLPIVGYAWAEFFPAAGQTWLSLIPMIALYHAANGAAGTAPFWIAGLYAFLGIILFAAAPRVAPRP